MVLKLAEESSINVGAISSYTCGWRASLNCIANLAIPWFVAKSKMRFSMGGMSDWMEAERYIVISGTTPDDGVETNEVQCRLGGGCVPAGELDGGHAGGVA